MNNVKTSLTFVTSTVSSVLAIINGLWIAIIDKPVIITTFNATSLDEIINSKNFWGRIVFGIPGIIGGLWTYFWIIFAVLMLLCAFSIYRKPRLHKKYSFLITLFALLTLPIGGGFYIGAILGFVGGLVGREWPKSFSETFLGNVFQAAMGRPKFYVSICEKSETLSNAALTVIFIGALSGFGNTLYTYNVDIIRKGESLASQILLQGYVLWNEIVLLSALSMVGMMMIKWLILSLCVYWIGAKLVGLSSSYDKVLRVVAFAYVPEIITVFMPLMFSNDPTLTFNWPVGFYVITRIWVFLCLLVAIQQVFDFSLTRAFGVALFGGAIYWLIYHVFMAPTLNVPGFRINISMPESSLTVLTLVSLATLIATALGIFSRKQAS